MEKSPEAFRTISEVAQDLGLPQHVLRFWETRFVQIRPLKRGGGRRYYRPDDVELLKAIRHLLYGEGYTIKGVQRLLKERGVRVVVDLAGTTRAQRRTAAAAVAGGPSPSEEDRQAQAPAPPQSPAPGGPTEGPAPSRAERAALSREDVERLRAILADLSECQRILAAAQAV